MRDRNVSGGSRLTKSDCAIHGQSGLSPRRGWRVIWSYPVRLNEAKGSPIIICIAGDVCVDSALCGVD
jgi:hypothetical protein